MKFSKRLAIVLVILLSAGVSLFAQEDLNAAGAIYNEGNEALKAKNYPEAIAKYEAALKVCSVIGMDADDLKFNIEKQLPSVQYSYGLDLVKQKKASAGLKVLKEALASAKTVNDQNIIDKSNKYISRILGSIGYGNTKKGAYDVALLKLDEALTYTPESGKIFLYKGLTYKEMGDEEKMDESLLNAITYGRAENDEKTAMNSIKTGRGYYIGLVQKAVEKKDYNQAIASADKALKFDDHFGLAYYFKAVSFNNLKQYDKAIEAASLASEFSDNAQETQAGIHLELGKAFEGNGDTANACTEYTQAAFGSFQAEAEYKMKEVLKCQ